MEDSAGLNIYADSNATWTGAPATKAERVLLKSEQMSRLRIASFNLLAPCCQYQVLSKTTCNLLSAEKFVTLKESAFNINFQTKNYRVAWKLDFLIIGANDRLSASNSYMRLPRM